MSMRSLMSWIGQAGPFRSTRRAYVGPLSGAVLQMNGTVVNVPNFTDYAGSRALLSMPVEDVLATFVCSSKGVWTGETEVPNLYDTMSTLHASAPTLNECVALIQTKRAEALCDLAELKADPARVLEFRLQHHDWWCMMSDSYSVTRAGERDMREIEALIPSVPVETVRTLWTKYAPAEFTCPV